MDDMKKALDEITNKLADNGIKPFIAIKKAIEHDEKVRELLYSTSQSSNPLQDKRIDKIIKHLEQSMEFIDMLIQAKGE